MNWWKFQAEVLLTMLELHLVGYTGLPVPSEWDMPMPFGPASTENCKDRYVTESEIRVFMKRKEMVYLLKIIVSFLLFSLVFRYWDQIKEVIHRIFQSG